MQYTYVGYDIVKFKVKLIVLYCLCLKKKQFVVHHVELINSAHHPIHVHVQMDGLDPIVIHVCELHNTEMFPDALLFTSKM